MIPIPLIILAFPSKLTCEQAKTILDGGRPVIMDAPTISIAGDTRLPADFVPDGVYQWSTHFEVHDRIALIADSGTVPPPSRACADGIVIGYDNGVIWRAPKSAVEHIRLALVHAHGYHAVRVDRSTLERRNASSTTASPPSPPFTPTPVYADSIPFRTDAHIAHASVGLLVVGVVLPTSVALAISPRVSRRTVRVVHGSSNVLSLLAFAGTAIALATQQDHGGSDARMAHAVVGTLILTVGTAVVVLTRVVPQWKSAHVVVGRIVVLGIASNVVLGAWVFAHRSTFIVAMVASGTLAIIMVYGTLHNR